MRSIDIFDKNKIFEREKKNKIKKQWVIVTGSLHTKEPQIVLADIFIFLYKSFDLKVIVYFHCGMYRYKYVDLLLNLEELYIPVGNILQQ